MHQRLVDREATGGVVDDDVATEPLRLCAGGSADVDGALAGNAEDRNLELRAEDVELLDGGGALHVGGDEQRLLLLFFEVARELRARRRLAGALEPDHHDPGRAALREGDGLTLVVHHLLQLVVADLDEEIARGHLLRLAGLLHPALQRLPDRLLLHAGEEGFDDADLDVRFEQAQADFAERGVDVAVGELGEPGEAIAGLAKAFGERVEHGGP